MKKAYLSMLLAIVIVLSLFSGCADNNTQPVNAVDDADSIRVCVDVNYVPMSNNYTTENAMRKLLARMRTAAASAGVEIPTYIKVEYVPASGPEREGALDRIRTEIMCGGGPDLFITVCDSNSPAHTEDALFTMPGKIMELGSFLTLDEYMENNTVFAEWDKMNASVLNAGRTEEGQQILPLCYTFPVSVYRAEDVKHTASKEITWMDMLESDDEALSAAAVQVVDFGVAEDGTPMHFFIPMTEFILGSLADYSEEELLFTEEELRQRMSETIQLGIELDNGMYSTESTHYDTYAGYMFTDAPHNISLNGIKYKDAHTMIPLYSDEGGITAEITAYTAINRNTKHPEDVFHIMDYLVSCNSQRSDMLYTDVLYYVGDTVSMPIYDELMAGMPVEGSDSGWYMPDENFAQLCAIQEQITNVKFRDVFDQEFQLLYQSYYEAQRRGEDPEQVVSEGYRKMQRMLRE